MQCEARLASAARSGQRHETGVAGTKQRDDLGHLPFPAQEGGCLVWEVLELAGERSEWREFRGEFGMDELKDTFGFEQIGEAAFAEVPQIRLRGRLSRASVAAVSESRICVP